MLLAHLGGKLGEITDLENAGLTVVLAARQLPLGNALRAAIAQVGRGGNPVPISLLALDLERALAVQVDTGLLGIVEKLR